MRVLAFDTCFNACSAAVLGSSGELLSARHEIMRIGHAERLCPMIDEIMAEARLSFAGLDAIAVTVGPGTFTGIRIGIAAARGFALAARLPVHGTTSLALLAATARAGLSKAVAARPIAACHDARKGEVLVEIVYPPTARLPAREDGALRLTAGSGALDRVRLLSPAAAAALIRQEAPDAVLVGSGAVIVSTAAADLAFTLETTMLGLEPDARYITATDLAPLDPPLPLYPRPPDAKPPANPSLARQT